MIREIHTIKEAAKEWVREMNAFPYSMIEKLVYDNIDDWYEVTVPSSGDRVYMCNFPELDVEGKEYNTDDNCGTIQDYNEEEKIYTIELDNGAIIECSEEDFEVDRNSFLPMWGTLWSFGDGCDDYWLENEDGIRKMSECGFRVYCHDEWGYFFGLDGAGYDFYGEHWIPLYKTRGLQWHDTEAA